MAVTGIIAEFNPMHSGHKRLINTVKETGDTIVCALGGNFVQRGEPAILSKQKRAEFTLRCGVDLVAEIPVGWSMSTAQNFALGGVSQLAALGCDRLAFGSECGNIQKLLHAAELENHPDFSEKLSEELKKGVTFAAARESTANALGFDAEIFRQPNDTLAVEYITAAKRIGWHPEFTAVQRHGCSHNALSPEADTISSSLLRDFLTNGNFAYAERFIPSELHGRIRPEMLSDFSRIETAILAVLRMKTPEDFKQLPDISEGIENKLSFSINASQSLADLYRIIKSKRYPLARVRRLVLSAFLGINQSFFGKRPPYVRVLGFSEKGEKHLKSNFFGNIPIVTRVSQIKELHDFSKEVFLSECRATDLYGLTFEPPLPCGAEFKNKLLKTEDLL